MNGEPTQEQTKEFWEWCGLHYQDYSSKQFPHMGGAWEDQDGITVGNEPSWEPPDIDLNNLFTYAVPKAIEELQLIHRWTYREAERHIFGLWLSTLKMNEYDVGLFWAIWQLIHEEA